MISYLFLIYLFKRLYILISIKGLIHMSATIHFKEQSFKHLINSFYLDKILNFVSTPSMRAKIFLIFISGIFLTKKKYM